MPGQGRLCEGPLDNHFKQKERSRVLLHALKLNDLWIRGGKQSVLKWGALCY